MGLATAQNYPAVKQVDVHDQAIDRVADAQAEAVVTLPDGRRDDVAVMQMADAHFALPDSILAKVDRVSMLNSLEVRVPFLIRTYSSSRGNCRLHRRLRRRNRNWS